MGEAAPGRNATASSHKLETLEAGPPEGLKK